MDKILHDPKDLNYGNYGIFLIMGNAGFCPSTVGTPTLQLQGLPCNDKRLQPSLEVPSFFLSHTSPYCRGLNN